MAQWRIQVKERRGAAGCGGAGHSQDVEHRVQPWRLAGQPLGGADSAVGEGPAVEGAVGQRDLLVAGGEQQGVLADDLAAAQGGKADRAGRAGTGVAVATADHHVFEPDPTAARHRPAQADGGAGGSVHFLAVVHLDDLRVVGAGGEGGGELLGERQDQGDAGGEVRGVDEGDLCGGLRHGGLVGCRKARCAQYPGRARLLQCFSVRLCRGGVGEVDHHVGLRGERREVWKHGNTRGRQLARSGPQCPSGDCVPGGCDLGREQQPHPAGYANDANPHAGLLVQQRPRC